MMSIPGVTCTVKDIPGKLAWAVARSVTAAARMPASSEASFSAHLGRVRCGRVRCVEPTLRMLMLGVLIVGGAVVSIARLHSLV